MMELPVTKIEKTDQGADQGEQSRESMWNYRFNEIGLSFKSTVLSWLIQDMITQKATKFHYALGVNNAPCKMDLPQIPRPA